MLPGLTFRAWAHWWSGNQRSDEIKMGMPFEPEEIDDLDESLLEEIEQEELADFRDQLQEPLDRMLSREPNPDKEQEAYYEWEDRVNVLQNLIDAIDSQKE